LDKFPVDSLQRYEQELYAHVESFDKTLLQDVAKKRVLDDDLKKRLKATLDAFNEKFELTVKQS
jgi:F-type H+-transporting ATPase subunit alpha